MLLAECLRKLGLHSPAVTRVRRNPSLSLQTVTEDRHTPENVEGLPVHRLCARLCSCHILEKVQLRKRRETRASASKDERKGNMHDEICSCVGWLWALAAWCCGIVSPPPSLQVSKSCMFPRPSSPLLSCCRMYASLVLSNWRGDVCVFGKIRNFKQ